MLRRQVASVLGSLLIALPAMAQDADTSEFEPGVDTSAYATVEPAVDTSTVGETNEDSVVEATTPAAVSTTPDLERQVANNGAVMDRMTLGRTEVTGNQELPKVMYIVPWKKSDPGDLMGRPVNTLLDEILAPVNREEFVREVGFYNDLYVSDENLSSP